MKILKWIIIIALAIGAGAWLSDSRQQQRSADAVIAQESVSESSIGSKDTAESSANTANPIPEVVKVKVPALEPIVYQPTSGEKDTLTLLNKFYEAYNLADSERLTSCFDLSVPVTQVISTSLETGKPRPTKVIIKNIETRSDGSQVVHLTETRSDNQSYEQELELMSTNSGLLVVAYRRSGNSGVVSGF